MTSCLDSPSEDAISQTITFLRQIQALKVTQPQTRGDISLQSHGKNHKANRKSLREYTEAVKNNVNANGVDSLDPSSLQLNITDEEDDELTPLGNYQGLDSPFERRQFCQKYFLNERTIKVSTDTTCHFTLF
ncbi:unnamed protein product [Trichobilharzia regenti]|nr:unnamed protein product [Trichobilharzia regenti]